LRRVLHAAIVASLLLLSRLAVPTVHAALSFTSTDSVNFGSASSIDDCFNNDGTMVMWVFPTATTAASTFARKDNTGAIWSFTGAASVQFTLARSTQSLAMIYTTANLPNFGTNKWVFIAVVWDTAGANGDQILYSGDLTHTVAAGSSPSPQRVGSGTVTSQDALSLFVGNNVGGAAPFPGNIAYTGLWNRRLSLGELQDQQFHPHVTSGSVIASYLGFNGTSSQPDWSGNGNAGTVTGSAVVAHVPIGRLFF
jgi:hypothetical protein